LGFKAGESEVELQMVSVMEVVSWD
jgi:hypothetical protein